LYEKLETYLDLYSDRTNQFYLFAINLLLKLKFNSKFNIQSIEVKLLNILQSASKPLIINDHLRINNYLNKGLDCFYTFLKLNEAIKNIDVLTDQFNANKQEIDYLCSLMFYLTNNKFEPIIKYSLNRVDNAFELLSLMKLMKCENKFYSYLKELIEYSYDLIFDEYFIMKQRLVGFEQLLNKYIFLNNDLKLNEKEIDVLQCVQDYITNGTLPSISKKRKEVNTVITSSSSSTRQKRGTRGGSTKRKNNRNSKNRNKNKNKNKNKTQRRKRKTHRRKC
jgi:hypothetical protein